MRKHKTPSKKRLATVLILVIVGIIGSFLLFKTMRDNAKYETSRDEVIKSPSGEYSITLRYDYVSRPYIFKDDKLIFETNKAGFNETVFFKVEWLSENELLLYLDMGKEKYKNDKYYITIN